VEVGAEVAPGVHGVARDRAAAGTAQGILKARRTEMIQLHDTESDAFLGEITESQLEFLTVHLEETEASDRDYYIDADTLDMLVDEGADPELVDLLRRVLGDGDGLEFRWSAEE
jgi:hypothetical protein